MSQDVRNMSRTCVRFRKQSDYGADNTTYSGKGDLWPLPQVPTFVSNLDSDGRRISPAMRNVRNADLSSRDVDFLVELPA